MTLTINFKKLVALINPVLFMFYFKQVRFYLVNRKNISIKHFSLSIDKSFFFNFHGNGKLCLGKKICIKNGVEIEVFENALVEIGNNFFINMNSSIISRYGIKIGDNCMIGKMVSIYDHNHCFEITEQPFNQQGFYGSPIIIGNNVWIGSGVFIGQGVHIGDSVVIGANAVITKSIPSYSLVHSNLGLITKKLSHT